MKSPERPHRYGRSPDRIRKSSRRLPLELRIYPGADADFRLYEDDGVSYGYEKGAFAVIPIHWDDASHTLTVDAREGSFPGMPGTRTFLLRVAGTDGTATLTYDGRSVSIRL